MVTDRCASGVAIDGGVTQVESMHSAKKNLESLIQDLLQGVACFVLNKHLKYIFMYKHICFKVLAFS